jgi:hypothetical protein
MATKPPNKLGMVNYERDIGEDSGLLIYESIINYGSGGNLNIGYATAFLADDIDLNINIPNGYNEAMESDNKYEWCKRMDEEIAALKANGTWLLCDLPNALGICCKI